MIVLMAGLPGCGKTTLARALAERLSGAVLDKDRVRAALFAPADIEYSTEQDDVCQRVMLEAAAYLLQNNPRRLVFLDGRPFSRRYQIEEAVRAAEAMGQPWRILECVCSEAEARRRIEAQAAAGEHPAGNRDYELYLAVKARFEPILVPKAIIDSDQPVETCVEIALRALEDVPQH
jgi:predicted kinase